MSLDFPHTCRTIDDKIEACKDELNVFVENLIAQVIPSELLDESNPKYTYFLEHCRADIEGRILPLFEDLRELNSDMRDQADEQISSLEQKLEEAEQVITEYEKRLEEWE